MIPRSELRPSSPEGSRAYVEQWLSRDLVQIGDDHDPETDGDFVTSFYQGCLGFFVELCRTLSTSESPSGFSQVEIQSLKEELGRLFLWGEGFSGETLGKIFEYAEHMKPTVLEFLAGVGKLLTRSMYFA